jgi:hypothetical protein
MGEMTSPGLGYNHCIEMCKWPSYYYIFVECFAVDGGKNKIKCVKKQPNGSQKLQYVQTSTISYSL